MKACTKHDYLFHITAKILTYEEKQQLDINLCVVLYYLRCQQDQRNYLEDNRVSEEIDKRCK